jgi:8-oxo-dGTP pyrophosphatase MutT (NUDIX family)
VDTDRIESGEWRTLASTLTHHGSYFDVRIDDVVRPDGSHGTYEHVVARGGVTVLALDEQDRVVLTRQWIYPHGNRQWRLPSGGIDPGDRDPEAAARRELAEETGLRAETWCPLGRVSGADSITNHVDHVFQATGLTRGADSREAGEADLEVSRLPFAETLELVLSGRMPHAGSAYAVLVAAARRAPR